MARRTGVSPKTMHRRNLLDKLAAYQPGDKRDAACRDRIVAFVRAHADCFQRSLAIGHITGAAWLLHPGGERVLLTHHRKLGKWLQLGGHADGDPDALAVAMREAREESGIEKIEPVSTAIFDVDVHPIPAREGEPGHDHYDIRFLLRVTGNPTFSVSSESHQLAWVSTGELTELGVGASVWRMHHKQLRLGTVARPRSR